jgi:hypothetical protein
VFYWRWECGTVDAFTTLCLLCCSRSQSISSRLTPGLIFSSCAVFAIMTVAPQHQYRGAGTMLAKWGVDEADRLEADVSNLTSLPSFSSATPKFLCNNTSLSHEELESLEATQSRAPSYDSMYLQDDVYCWPVLESLIFSTSNNGTAQGY